MSDPKLEIQRVLVLSTGHVSEKTAGMLSTSHHGDSEFSPPWWPSFTREEGWLFYVPLDLEPLESGWFAERYGDAPDDVRACAAFARDNGCCWLMLDRDGPVVDLPTHEW